ncbi:MAG: dephospho-CoA kinase [Capsulimonadaceae bacterium]
MRILGITGGVATGKSTITRLFADLGAETLSADDVARDLLAPGTPAADAVAARFPDAVASHEPITIDRAALGRIVFADSGARRDLEAILHPPIIAEIRRWIAERRRSDGLPVAAVEIPLLFEAGQTGIVDRVVVVACPPEIQRIRLVERPNMTDSLAVGILAAQWPLADKVAEADYVIDTAKDVDSVRGRVMEIWKMEAFKN